MSVAWAAARRDGSRPGVALSNPWHLAPWIVDCRDNSRQGWRTANPASAGSPAPAAPFHAATSSRHRRQQLRRIVAHIVDLGADPPYAQLCHGGT
jgi:hypothetical protein